jgi:HlyD family secretion protein
MCEKHSSSKECLVALAAGMLAAVGCGASGAPSGPSVSTTPAAKVNVVHPTRRSLIRVVEQPGTVQAYEETVMFARVPGYVRLFHDKDGRIIHEIGRKIRGPKYDPSGARVVEPGEVLAELVVPELEQRALLKEAMVRQAEADVDQARKVVASAEANIATKDAAVVEAKALRERWESESKRFASLAKTGTITDQSRDEILNEFKAAGARVLSTEAAVLKAKADRDKSMADVRAMQARVDVAKADASEAEALLSYAKIRAPYDGVVTSRKANTGDFVQPTGGQADWLFKVARLDPVRVVIAVPEADADLVKEKSEVKLTVPDLTGPSLSGTVARTSWVLDTAARTLRTEIDLPNKSGRLRPGMYVYAQIINRLPEEWTLPVSAVVSQGNSTVCFLIEDGKAVRTPVQLGRSDGQLVQVLKKQERGKPTVWQDFTGKEVIAGHAEGLTDGQVVQGDAAGK